LILSAHHDRLGAAGLGAGLPLDSFAGQSANGHEHGPLLSIGESPEQGQQFDQDGVIPPEFCAE
jgi:hypothetical protein